MCWYFVSVLVNKLQRFLENTAIFSSKIGYWPQLGEIQNACDGSAAGIIIITELTQSKTIRKNSLKIMPQPAALDVENLS